ncbi:MAG: hypothetical protein ABFE08_06380 [Armatimonadia bacterium]
MKIANPKNLVVVLRRIRGRRMAVALIAAAVLLISAGAMMIVRSNGVRHGATPQLAMPPAPGTPGAAAVPTQPGLAQFDDFQVVIPEGWERRQDLEDGGPGTKLILFGPKVAETPLFVGIDVYPLRAGTTLEQFVGQYVERSLPGRSPKVKKATLCDQPARMLGLTESGVDKVYLVAVYKDKGFVVGMIGPSGHLSENTQAFREVVDTFSFYE